MPTARRAVEGKAGFSEEAQKELGKNFDLAEKMFKSVIKALENGDMDIANEVLEYRKELREHGRGSV